MIRKGLSKTLHAIGHGFEWSSTQCHTLGDKALNLPKWMDLKTEEACQAIRDWNERQEAAFQKRMAKRMADQRVADDLLTTLQKAAQAAADASVDQVQKVQVNVL